MQRRILKHKLQREEKFSSIEEPHDLLGVIKEHETYLIDCISMWILNNIEQTEQKILETLKSVLRIESNLIFVLNDVNSGVIPFEKESRKFVDLTGIIGQKLASLCDEVYEVKLGLPIRLK